MQYLVTSSRAGVAGAAALWADTRAGEALAWRDLEASKHVAPIHAPQKHAINVFCIVMVLTILRTSFTSDPQRAD
jgi:hypothetical protein